MSFFDFIFGKKKKERSDVEKEKTQPVQVKQESKQPQSQTASQTVENKSNSELSSDISPCFNPQALPNVKMTEQFSMCPINENTLENDADTLATLLMFDKDTKEFMPDFTGFNAKENIKAYFINSFMTQNMGIAFAYIIRYNAGICGLIKVTSPTHNKVTNNFNHWLIDYVLIPPFRGHKIMKSALPIVFDIMKNRLGISEPIYAMVCPDNNVSIHLLKLNNFVEDTTSNSPIDVNTGKKTLLYKKLL